MDNPQPPPIPPPPTPDAPPPVIVASGSSTKFSKRAIVISLGVLTILVVGIIVAVILVQRVQRPELYAWDCNPYNFTVSLTGEVTVQNLSSRNEQAQRVSISVNG